MKAKVTIVEMPNIRKAVLKGKAARWAMCFALAKDIAPGVNDFSDTDYSAYVGFMESIGEDPLGQGTVRQYRATGRFYRSIRSVDASQSWSAHHVARQGAKTPAEARQAIADTLARDGKVTVDGIRETNRIASDAARKASGNAKVGRKVKTIAVSGKRLIDDWKRTITFVSGLTPVVLSSEDVSSDMLLDMETILNAAANRVVVEIASRNAAASSAKQSPIPANVNAKTTPSETKAATARRGANAAKSTK